MNRFDDRLKEIVAARVEGNKNFGYFKLLNGHSAEKEKLLEAGAMYAEALGKIGEISKDLDDAFELDDESKDSISKRINHEKNVVLLNMALVSLKLGAPEQCHNCCDEVLSSEPDNIKANFRKAEAFLFENRYSEALICLKFCLEIEPENKEILEKTKNVRKILDSKIINEKLEDDGDSWKISSEWLKGNNISENEATNNGSTIMHPPSDVKWGYSYCWRQTLSEVNLVFRLFRRVSFEKISIELKPKQIIFKNASVDLLILDLKADNEYAVLESSWQIEKDYLGHNYFTLQLLKRGPKNKGINWWKGVFEGDYEIDPQTQCKLSKSELNELPDDIKAEWKRNLERGIESGEVKTRLDELEKLDQLQLEAEESLIQREENNDRARRDPSKKLLLEMMEQNFPNIPVEIKTTKMSA